MKRLQVIGLGVVALCLLNALGVHVYAQVFRFRAEHLLGKLKTFRVEETSAATVLRLRHDYHSNVTDYGPCSEEHCRFSIGLIEWGSLSRLMSNHPWTERPMYFVIRGLRCFGLRLTGFGAQLLVRNGRLQSLDVWLIPASYIEFKDGFLSTIYVSSRTVGNFRRWVSRPQLYAHPNLFVSKPTACTGCSGAITAEFTWQASHDEFEQAMDFDLSCITRVRDCRKPEEYLPRAAEMLSGHDENTKPPCDTRMARLLGRDSDFVDVVRIKSVKPDNGEFVVVDYDLLRPLKGRIMRLSNIYHDRELAAGQSSSGPAHPLLEPGAERIVFLGEILEKPSVESDCAVMALTPENLSAALEGVADDRSSVLSDE